MSIFNFNLNNSNNDSIRSLSPRLSPFCTSPSQLQEMTLENNSFHSTGGPIRGKSVKEFEEQLAALKRENFNLKLRIYFLEERLGPNFNCDNENILKQNVELNVEVEGLRKEVKEQIELLDQASKALDLQEDETKKLCATKDKQIEEYQQEIECLKTKFTTMCDKEDDLAVQFLLNQKDTKIKSLDRDLTAANERLAFYENHVKELEETISETRVSHKEMCKNVQEKTDYIENLLHTNDELRKEVNHLRSENQEKKTNYNRLSHTTKELESKLQIALFELRKSQDLVVQSPAHTSRHTDVDSFSVSQSTSASRLQENEFPAFHEIPATTDISNNNIIITSPVTNINTNDNITIVQQTSSLTSTSITSPVTSPDSDKTFDNLLNIDNITNNELSSNVVSQIKVAYQQQQQKIFKLKTEQLKACKIIKSMIESKNKCNEEMARLKKHNEDLEKGLIEISTKYNNNNNNNNPSKCQGDSPSALSQNQMDDLDYSDVELVHQLRKLVQQLEEKNELLVSTLNERKIQMDFMERQYQIVSDNVSAYQKIIDEKNVLIEERNLNINTLTTELAKRNTDLQGIINKELWSKNKEIEKLQKYFDDAEIKKLKNDLQLKDNQLNLIKQQITEIGIEIDSSFNLEGLSLMKKQLLLSEKLRSEAYDTLKVLSTRLEELAIFLDSLLKQKSVLGFLGREENRKLRQIINDSIDLSRSLAFNKSETLALINTNNSLCETELSFNNCTLTSVKDKTLNYHENSINISNLIKELRNLKHNNDHSESEAWSEPDRSVSKARIGLLDETLKGKSNNESESTEEENNDIKNKSIKVKNTTITDLNKQILELNEKLSLSEKSFNDISHLLNEEKILNIDLKKRFNELESQIKDIQRKKVSAENEIVKLKTFIDELQSIKTTIEMKYNDKNKEVQNLWNEIEVIKIQTMKEVEEAEKTTKLIDDEKKILEEKLRVSEELAEKRLREIEDKAQLEIKLLNANISELKSEYTNNYLKKCEVASLTKSLSECISKERELKQKLADTEEKYNNTREEIDNLTLRFSEAVLGKTKLASDKSSLEQELFECKTKEQKLINQIKELEVRVNEIKNEHQVQMSSLATQKSKLEYRISKLEQSNAEFQNKIIKLQAKQGTQFISTSLPINLFHNERNNGNDNSDIDDQPHSVGGYIREKYETASSPDLGIDSDQGRFSSLEIYRPMLPSLQVSTSVKNMLEREGHRSDSCSCNNDNCVQNFEELSNENRELKKKYENTKKVLEDTASQLVMANQRKRQVEKTICKQIHKTSQVLRKAKANLDSGSETDLYKK